jgi:adenylate cyclase
MALFGAPTASPRRRPQRGKGRGHDAETTGPLNDELRAEGLGAISMGIGLHTGEATIGYIGSDKRSEYTAIGDTVNLASRLESNAAGGQILMSEASARQRKRIPVNAREPLTVKNRQSRSTFSSPLGLIKSLTPFRFFLAAVSFGI